MDTEDGPRGDSDVAAVGAEASEGDVPDDWRVRIWYREPGYELRRGGGVRVYRWTYAVRARYRMQAVDHARRRFMSTARDSGVGWCREIVRISAWPKTGDGIRV